MEAQRAQAMQRMQLVPGDPRPEQAIRIDNDITDMDIDITIEEGIDVPEHPGRAVPDPDSARCRARSRASIPPEILIAASSLAE